MKKKLTKILGVGLTIALLASLTVFAVPVGATVSSATVSQTVDIISNGSTYTLIFSITQALNAATPDTIDVEFPAGFDVSGASAQLAATSGIGTTAFPLAAANVTVDGANSQLLHIDVNNESGDANDDIGVGATVQCVIGTDALTDVTNGTALGDDYVLKVSTSVETTQVDSDTFSLVAPTIPPVPGIVMGYNASGVKLYENVGNVINACIGTAGVVTIEVGAGTYPGPVTANVAGQTITSADGAATTIISGAVTLSDKVTFDGFTVQGILTADTVADSTVTNCVLQGNPGVDANIDVDLTNNTYEVGTGETGIDVADTVTATVSGGTFDVTGTGILNAGTLVLADATLTGASGTGVQNTDTDESATITGTTFSGLEIALDIDNGTVDIQTSTITGCGDATSGSENPAIDIDGAVLVTIMNNTIDDCLDDIMTIADTFNEEVFMNFNAINNPAKGIDSEDADPDADCTNNLWDGGVAPPVTSDNATTTPYLTGAVSNPVILPATTTLTASTTAGVNIVASGGTPTNATAMGAATYAANPGTAAVPGMATAYYDVYVDPGTSDATTYTISLFGTVDANTIAYVWGAGLGEWVACSNQAVNIFAGTVSVTVTATTIPTINDLVGLPMAIAQPAAAPPTVAATGLVPAMGADDVTVDPTFAWGAVTGAISYDFALAEDNPLAADPFDIIDYSAQTTINAHPAQQTLKYSTTYYWRVRAVTATETGPWTTGLFTTEAEPEEEEAGDIIVDVPDVTVDSPDITVQPAEVDITVEPAQPVIPDYLLWVIIAVGAVLVIALIVLIVRTRRTA